MNHERERGWSDPGCALFHLDRDVDSPRRAERSRVHSNILLLSSPIHIVSQHCAEHISHFTRRAKGRPPFVHRVLPSARYGPQGLARHAFLHSLTVIGETHRWRYLIIDADPDVYALLGDFLPLLTKTPKPLLEHFHVLKRLPATRLGFLFEAPKLVALFARDSLCNVYECRCAQCFSNLQELCVWFQPCHLRRLTYERPTPA
jgi:hypothetical protein